MQWLVERSNELIALLTALVTLTGLIWKLKLWSRFERAARWFWGEVRSTIWAKGELIQCRRQREIREATFATMETENRVLLERVVALLEFCGPSDSGHRNQLPATTTSPDDSPTSPGKTA